MITPDAPLPYKHGTLHSKHDGGGLRSPILYTCLNGASSGILTLVFQYNFQVSITSWFFHADDCLHMLLHYCCGQKSTQRCDERHRCACSFGIICRRLCTFFSHPVCALLLFLQPSHPRAALWRPKSGKINNFPGASPRPPDAHQTEIDRPHQSPMHYMIRRINSAHDAAW